MEACPLVWVQEDTSKSFPKMESFLRKSSFCVKRYLQVMHSFLHNLNFPRTFWNTFILGTFKTLYWERCYCDEPRGRMVQSCANWHGTLATQPNPELLCQANSRINMKTENLDNYGQNHEGFFFFSGPDIYHAADRIKTSWIIYSFSWPLSFPVHWTLSLSLTMFSFSAF